MIIGIIHIILTILCYDQLVNLFILRVYIFIVYICIRLTCRCYHTNDALLVSHYLQTYLIKWYVSSTVRWKLKMSTPIFISAKTLMDLWIV